MAEAKKDKKDNTCTACQYRVYPPDSKGERYPSCCFHLNMSTEENMREKCSLFTEPMNGRK